MFRFVKQGIPPAAKKNKVKILDMTNPKEIKILNEILNSYDGIMASYIEHLWVDSNNKNIVYIHFNNSVAVNYLSILMLMREFSVPELPNEDTNFKIPYDTPNKETLDEIIDRINSSKEEIKKEKQRKEVNSSGQREIMTPEQWEAKLDIARLETPDMIPLFKKSDCFMNLYNSVTKGKSAFLDNSVTKGKSAFLDNYANTIAKIAATLPVNMEKYNELLAEFLSGTTYIHTKLASVFQIEPTAFSGYKIADTRILHELYTVLILSLANIYKDMTINNIYAVAYLMNQAGRFTFDTATLRSKFFDVIKDVLEAYGSPIKIIYDCYIKPTRSDNNIKNIEYTCGRYVEMEEDINTIYIKQTVSMSNNTIMNSAGSKGYSKYDIPAKRCMAGGYGTLTGARLSSRTLKHLINKSITKTKKQLNPKRKHRTAKRL